RIFPWLGDTRKNAGIASLDRSGAAQSRCTTSRNGRCQVVDPIHLARMLAARISARPQLWRLTRALTRLCSLLLLPCSFRAGYFADSINSVDRQQFGGGGHPVPELSLPRRSATARP